MKVRFEIVGSAPLIMHSAKGVDPLHPLVKEIKKLTGKRKKTEDDLEQIARLEFEVSMYFLDGIGPYLPGVNIERCLVEGGRITRAGKTIERGLFVTDNEVPLIYEGPRTIEGLWDNPNFRSMEAVGVGGRKIIRCRPIFREWAADCDAEIDPTVLNFDELKQIADHAGSMAGLGDWRPRYGRFNVNVIEL